MKCKGGQMGLSRSLSQCHSYISTALSKLSVHDDDDADEDHNDDDNDDDDDDIEFFAKIKNLPDCETSGGL